MIISGKQPAHCVLYGKHRKPNYMFSHDFKNYIAFSPYHPFCSVGAFGSLNGQIDIWNYKKKEYIGVCSSIHSSIMKWSYDTKHFMTAIIFDKLKVDHKIDIFEYTGKKVAVKKMETFDLINVDFVAGVKTHQNLNYEKKTKKRPNFGLLKIKPEKTGPINAGQIKNYIP